MYKVKIIEIHENIYAESNAAAKRIRERMTRQKTLFLNIMSAPGSGKTTLLIALINLLKKKYIIGNIDVDMQSSLDAGRVADATDVLSIQIHNGGLCHIDADMVERALEKFENSEIDILFLENIGNMVCPAEFDTGTHKNIMIYSVPEGDDKPLKYPLMFQQSDIVLINKIDTLQYFNFNMDKAVCRIFDRNPNARIIPVSAKNGDGLEQVVNWIEQVYEETVDHKS